MLSAEVVEFPVPVAIAGVLCYVTMKYGTQRHSVCLDVLTSRAECACSKGRETFIAQFILACAELEM